MGLSVKGLLFMSINYKIVKLKFEFAERRFIGAITNQNLVCSYYPLIVEFIDPEGRLTLSHQSYVKQ